jgi:hypothetical protein
MGRRGDADGEFGVRVGDRAKMRAVSETAAILGNRGMTWCLACDHRRLTHPLCVARRGRSRNNEPKAAKHSPADSPTAPIAT